MKTNILISGLLLGAVTFVSAATNDLANALQRGLFEEEANQNLGAAIQAYQTVAGQFDKDRKLAATAIFRLGECYRKQGNTNDAAAQYERVLREFSDQPALVTLSRQNLAGLGSAPAASVAPALSDAARQEQKRLLEEEIKLVEQQLASQNKLVETGRLAPDELVPTQRDLLKLKRQLAALDAGLPVSITATEAATPATSSDAEEVKHIQALIKDSPDLINAADRLGETLLQSAAGKGKLAVVKLLLDSGAAVDGLQQPGLTALHYAAGNGHKAIVDLLLSKGAKPGAQTEGGVTALHFAARKGYETVAKALLAAGAPVNARTTGYDAREVVGGDLQYRLSTTGQTPLHLAANAGYPALVELLLAKGAEVNAVDDVGRTPLSYAVDKRYQPVTQLLLAAHANPNAGASDLPLIEAAYHGDMPALKLLLASGADANINTNLSGEFRGVFGLPSSGGNTTPLAVAISQKHPDAVAELLRAKADPNGSTPDGFALVFSALADPPTLKALLDGGANPNCLDRDGYSPLMNAVAQGREPAVELLLAHKADPNVGRTQYGWTPLHEAARRGGKAIAELLLKAGAEVNARAKDGFTPLHIAVSRNQRELADFLLANKADPNERNNAGQTPLDMAKSMAQQNQLPPPGMPPGQPYSGPAAAREQEPKPETMADLLRRRGALDDLPHLDQIGVRRSTIAYSETPFTKGARDWSEFTLLELIAVQCQLLAAGPDQVGGSRSGASSLFGGLRLSFPDLAHLHISRPSADLKSWQDQVVDLTPVVASGDCAKDVRLRWGDVVEIPEADHPLNERWTGFSKAELANLKKCLTRKVEIVVKGQTTTITLAPRIVGLESDREPGALLEPQAPPQPGLGMPQFEPTIYTQTPFWIRPVLLQSKLVLISSDLARVKVTHRDPATGQPREWVVDCSKSGDSAPNLWLQDGDRIEVPEKSFASASQTEVPPAAPPAMLPPPAAAPPRLNAIPQPPARALRLPAAQPPPATVPLQYQWQSEPPKPMSAPELRQATPPPAPGEQAAKPFAGRLANVVERLPAAQTAQAERGSYLDVGGVRYSPKADDSELLRAGYHKDRSAKMRQAELWEERAASELSGRACPAVWTGTDMVVFGGEGMGTSFDNGARYSLAEDTWAMLPEKGAPSSRTGYAMVWTGKEVIVWGGFGGVWGKNTNHNDGARYNPVIDTWKPVSTKNSPAARFDFPAVWTGKEMLVWGGYTDNQSRYQGAHADAYLNTGGRYNPATDTWKAITTDGAPSRRSFHSQLWTGKEMLVWGGGNASKVLNDGARYDPARDAWKRISTDGAPSPRAGHVSVWAGKEMLVWGGSAREPSAPSDYFENGARYNPETDTWKPMSTIGAPKGRVSVTAVWTGSEMVLWGGVNDAQASGQDDANRYVGTGARYNPATDTWTEITTTGAPSPRLTSVVWTGDGLLTFGGYNGGHLNDTWFYSPQRALYPYAKQ